jgi:hypothetical protein
MGVGDMNLCYSQLSAAGRLGNQLWQIASTCGLAHKYDMEPQFPKWDYQPYFNVPEEFFVDRPRGLEASQYARHMDDRAKPYLQDLNLFKNIEDQIKLYFQPSEQAIEILASIDFLDKARERGKPLTSLHVRRGDNVTHPIGIHPLRSMDYYRTCIDLRKDTTLVCFSDDIAWCKENFSDVCEFYYEGIPRPREYEDRAKYDFSPVLDWIDLILQSTCDFHIISNSTYSWWGAYLSQDQEILYPSNWFGYQLDYIDSSLMFEPTRWKEIYDPTQGGISAT